MTVAPNKDDGVPEVCTGVPLASDAPLDTPLLEDQNELARSETWTTAERIARAIVVVCGVLYVVTLSMMLTGWIPSYHVRKSPPRQYSMRTTNRVAAHSTLSAMDQDVVLSLTEENFDENLSTHEHVFVDFYAPWSSWCKRLAPTWSLLANRIKEEGISVDGDTVQVQVVKVDCVAQAELCRKENIRSYPTIRWYKSGQAVSPDFMMDRTVDSLMEYARHQIEGDRVVLSERGWSVSDSDDYSSVENSEEAESEEVEESLDFLFPGLPSDSVEYSSVDYSEEGTEESYDEEEDDEEPQESRFITDDEISQDRPAAASATAETLPAMHQDYARALTKENFDENLSTHEHVFVDFYAPWCTWCKRLAPTWSLLAKRVEEEGISVDDDVVQVQVVKVDCVAQPDLCRKERIMAFPTMRWYKSGQAVSPDYKMDRTVGALIEYARHQIEGDGVVLSERGWSVSDSVDYSSVDYSEEAESEEEEVEESSNFPPLPGHKHGKLRAPDYTSTIRAQSMKPITGRQVAEGGYSAEDYDDDYVIEVEVPEEVIAEPEGAGALANGAMGEDFVRALTKENFDENLSTHQHILVNFYAPWCVWSQRLAPTWSLLAKRIQQEGILVDGDTVQVQVVKVDCVAQPDLCRKEKICSFPTIRWYRSGQAVSPDYKMDRTVSALIEYARRQIEGDGVVLSERGWSVPNSVDYSEESEEDEETPSDSRFIAEVDGSWRGSANWDQKVE